MELNWSSPAVLVAERVGMTTALVVVLAWIGRQLVPEDRP